jgi:hypothetical protein
LRNLSRLPAFIRMEHFNDMNHDHRPDSDRDDDLDALFASRPVRLSADFTEKTLARIALAAGESDPALDALLATRPVAASPDMPDRVIAAVATERRRRFILLRVASPLALAACLALAALPALMTGRVAGDRVTAALNADAELSALAALPVSKNSVLHSEELATLADLGAAFASEAPDSAYEI